MGHVRFTTGLGLIGVGVALSAAAAAPASAAVTGTTYESTASAIAGYVAIGGHVIPVPDNSVTATDGNSPQRAALGIGAIEKALKGTALGSSLQATLPTGLNVVTESASANANGTSSACAGFIAGDCTANDQTQPITLSLSLADLPHATLPSTPKGGASGLSLPAGVNKVLGGSSSAGSVPGAGSLADYKIVVTVAGPTAECTAGPAGSGSGFTAHADLARVTVDIEQGGKSVLPSGPVVADAGQILGKLNNLGLPKQLNKALGGHGLPTGAIQLALNPGSTTGVGTGPETTATAGEVQLGIGGHEVLHLIGAKATCGANNAATTTKTKHETPLTGIQTDEGRSGSAGTALWLGVTGGAALAGTAGGLTIWRRRRS